MDKLKLLPKVDVVKVAPSQEVNLDNSSIDFKTLVMPCAPFKFYLRQNMGKWVVFKSQYLWCYLTDLDAF